MAFPDSDLDIVVEVYLGADPTADPGSWPAPTDLSTRLVRKPVAISRGRGRNQSTLQASSCTFWLENTDGALTPTLATSTYYPDWDLGVPVALSVDNVGASPPYTRQTGHVSDIKPVMIPGAGGENISAVQVTVSGITRRLTQGAVPKSAMRRFYENVSPQPVGYWALENGDRRAALTFQSGLEGGADLVVAASTAFGVNRPFAAAGGVTPGPPGAASATDTSSGGRLRAAEIPVVADATTARAEFSMLADGYENTFPGLIYLYNAIPVTGGLTRIGVVAQDLGSGWQVGVDWTNPSGSNAAYASGVRILQDNRWYLIQLDITSSGGGANTDYVLRIDGVTVLSGTATNQTWSPVTRCDTNILATDVDQQCHLAVWSGTSLPTAADSYEAFLGHAGELAHDRIARICDEEGIPFSGTATVSAAMGAQPVADPVGLMRECESVDHGMLIEDFAFGLDYRSSDQRSNLDPAVTVDLATYRTTAGTQAEVLVPVRNDRGVRNEWTISNPVGSEATFVDETHQAKHGRYNDAATINVQDQQLIQDASWRVHEGTFGALRYDLVPLDLGANPSTLLPAWLEMGLGDRLDRTNHLAEHPTDDVRLEVEGYAETIRHRSWEATLNAEPYDTWDIGIVADTSGDTDPLLGRLAGDALAATRAAIDDNDLSIAFDPNCYRWTTAADDFDPDLKVRLGGEVVEVSTIATTAATFVAAGAMSSADNAAVTPALYAGHTAGDWICVLARIRAASAGTIATPPGYTRIEFPGHTASGEMQLFVKVHDGSESDPTVTPSGGSAGDTVSAVTFGLRNMPVSLDDLNDAVVEASALTNTSAQNIAYPGLAVRKDHAPIDGCVVLLLGGKDDDWTSVAAVSGFTEAVDSSTTTGNDQGLVVDYVIQTTATAVGHGSFAVTGGASAVSNGMTVAFAGGYQTMTVSARSVNGVVKSHTAGTLLEVEDALVLGL